MTGPFCPITPRWMWAAMPARLLVRTMPLTVLSVPTEIVFVPDA